MEQDKFNDIPGYSSWKAVEPISKGWSSDKKYRIITDLGEELLLRISSKEKYENKKKEYEIIGKFSSLGFPMSMPIAFGLCSGGENVFMLLSWVKGQELEETLPTLPEKRQYLLGRQAGKILKKIHGIPVAVEDMPKETHKAKKLRQLDSYIASDVRVPGDEAVIKYVRDNIDIIWNQPPVYQHGDFHTGNLVLTDDGNIGVIDFNRWSVGDPYEEFYKLESFGVEVSVPYCIGQIDAYFDDAVPDIFWRTLAVYVAHASLYSIKWAEPFGQKDMDGMVERYVMANRDFNGFRETVPLWYKSGKY